MAELNEGQKIIFRHPTLKELRVGIVIDKYVHYLTTMGSQTSIQCSIIQEWCDAEAAFKAWSLQEVRIGSFEWNEGPTVEPIK